MEVIRSIYGYPDWMYNCSNRTTEQWAERGERWPILGTYLVIGGFIYIMMYSSSLYAVWKLGLFKFTCYRIMFALGCVDVANLMCNSIIIGYLAYIGAVYCTSPFWMYIEGAANIFCWTTVSCLYMLLAINRVFSMIDFRAIEAFFQIGKGWLWLSVAFAYGFYGGIVCKPLMFSSHVFAATWVPYITDDFEQESRLYENTFHAFNNFLVAGVLFISYAFLLIYVKVIRRSLRDNNVERNVSPEGLRQNSSQNDAFQLFLQVVLISIPALMASILYVSLQYLIVPKWVLVVAHLSWHHATGVAAIVYLSLNKEVKGYFRRQTYVKNLSSSSKVGTVDLQVVISDPVN